MDTFVLALLFMAFVLLGAAVTSITWKKDKVGFLRIDDSDPDGLYMFLEITKGNVDKLRKSKYVVLEVKNENFIPRN